MAMPRILDTHAAAPVPDEVVAAAAPVPDEEGLKLLWLGVVAAACTQAPMARVATAGGAPWHAATTTDGTPWRRRAVATTHGDVQQ